MRGKRVGIYVDGKTFMEPLPEINAKREMTARLVSGLAHSRCAVPLSALLRELG